MFKINYNPDVLNCLANLSSDEIFTPPTLTNQILDLLPDSLWNDRNITFLDPVSKSGIFLREIAKRLMVGLEQDIPDKQERVNHILTKQLYGIAITELTSLISRRTLYCSKSADGKYSICDKFNNAEGNIIYSQIQHTWKSGSCVYCGASKNVLDRSLELETHAYQFIHADDPKEILDMKFDVIIGNPPYQLKDGGHGKSASPIYHKFVQQAKKLTPRYLAMIIPSRWLAGGKGLNEFRLEMLNDERIRKLVDFEDASEVFPGVDIAGGICYFLWERDSRGSCEVTNVHKRERYVSVRPLDEFTTFIRHSQAVPIIRKVMSEKEKRMKSQVTSRKPFGLATNIRPMKNGDISLRWQNGEGPYNSKNITNGIEMIPLWKVITSYVAYDHAGNPGKDGRRRIFSKIDILPPKTICTETYLVVGAYKTKQEAVNLIAYMKTRFFRFLVSQFMYSHHITKDAYAYVPVLDMKIKSTDEN